MPGERPTDLLREMRDAIKMMPRDLRSELATLFTLGFGHSLAPNSGQYRDEHGRYTADHTPRPPDVAGTHQRLFGAFGNLHPAFSQFSQIASMIGRFREIEEAVKDYKFLHTMPPGANLAGPGDAPPVRRPPPPPPTAPAVGPTTEPPIPWDKLKGEVPEPPIPVVEIPPRGSIPAPLLEPPPPKSSGFPLLSEELERQAQKPSLRDRYPVLPPPEIGVPPVVAQGPMTGADVGQVLAKFGQAADKMADAAQKAAQGGQGSQAAGARGVPAPIRRAPKVSGKPSGMDNQFGGESAEVDLEVSEGAPVLPAPAIAPVLPG